MRTPILGLLLLGTLTLASCGQNAAAPTQPDQATSPSTPEAAPTNLNADQLGALRTRIADVQQLRDDVRAGRVAAPLDDTGAALDLDALLGALQADLNEGLQLQQLPVPDLSAQRVPYASSTYKSVSANNSFRSQYSSLRGKYPSFNWTTDGCSGPSGYTGWSDEFYWPCRQHDFGYRNARHYPSLMNETHRHWVDGQFKQHMQNVCDDLGWRKYPCYAAAQAFYTAVYYGGKGSFY